MSANQRKYSSSKCKDFAICLPVFATIYFFLLSLVYWFCLQNSSASASNCSRALVPRLPYSMLSNRLKSEKFRICSFFLYIHNELDSRNVSIRQPNALYPMFCFYFFVAFCSASYRASAATKPIASKVIFVGYHRLWSLIGNQHVGFILRQPEHKIYRETLYITFDGLLKNACFHTIQLCQFENPTPR